MSEGILSPRKLAQSPLAALVRKDEGTPHPGCTFGLSSACSVCQIIRVVPSPCGCGGTDSVCTAGFWIGNGMHNRLYDEGAYQ